MKTAKSYKILLLIAALFVSLIMVVCGLNFQTASADAVKGSDYFTLSKSGASAITLDGNYATFSVTDGDKISLKNKINVLDFDLVSVIPEQVKEFELQITADAYYVNGNKDADGKMVTGIDRVINFTKKDASTFTVNDNAYEAEFDVAVSVVESLAMDYSNGYLKLSSCTLSDDDYNDFYRIAEKWGIVPAKVAIEFVEVDGDTSVDYKIASINAQSFELTSGDFTSKVEPEILPNDAMILTDKVLGCEYSVTFTQYSVLGGSDEIFCKSTTDGSVVVKENKVVFTKEGALNLEVYKKDAENNDALVKTLTYIVAKEDASAPKYKDIAVAEDARQNFVDAINDKLIDEETDTFVALGSNQYLTLPSFKDLIVDDNTAYSDLKLTVYYRTPTTTSSSTTLRIPLSEAGDYMFYVVAEDKFGNKIDSDKGFFYFDNDGNYVEGDYIDYVFTFSVEDNYPIKVEAASQGKGYKNVSYTATAFDITSSAYTAEYKLFYSATEIGVEDEGWVEIPKASSITDEEYSENGYLYSDIQAIAYNGTTTFTPDKTGYYKISCTVTSNSSNRIESASTIINIEEQPKLVYVDNHWLQNNVWSVVFLSIGTLCLIGIIVLLCIKPKEDKDND